MLFDSTNDILLISFYKFLEALFHCSQYVPSAFKDILDKWASHLTSKAMMRRWCSICKSCSHDSSTDSRSNQISRRIHSRHRLRHMAQLGRCIIMVSYRTTTRWEDIPGGYVLISHFLHKMYCHLCHWVHWCTCFHTQPSTILLAVRRCDHALHSTKQCD